MILITEMEDHEMLEKVVPAKSSWSGVVKKALSILTE
jgi:hypothetical protein